MNLEVITRRATSRSQYPPVVFVHGGFHAAWCWDEFFLPYFSRHGFDAHALSLRGHGKSEGGDKLNQWGLADYCDDVAEVCSDISDSPILIGHSIGAVIIQQYVQNHHSAAIVMIAPTPLASMTMQKLRWAVRFPITTAKMLMMRDINYSLPALQHLFFPPDMSADQVHEYMARMQKESNRVFQDIAKLCDANPKGIQLPTLILAAEQDRVPSTINERLADAFSAKLQTLPVAHDVMLTPQWQLAADRIIQWLSDTELLSDASHNR